MGENCLTASPPKKEGSRAGFRKVQGARQLLSHLTNVPVREAGSTVSLPATGTDSIYAPPDTYSIITYEAIFRVQSIGQ